jgi:Domain of unknown function DUF29
MQTTELEYDRWLESQITCLKNQNFTGLDLNNLIEELEALGRAEKSAVKSLAFQILIHMLLVDYWTEESVYSKNHWQAEINAFKYQLSDKLTTNYKIFLVDNLDKIYEKARTNAVLKSNLPSDRFPDTCPYQTEDLLEKS